MKITDERWNIAQKAERECHDGFLGRSGADAVKAHYKNSYARYFHYLDIDYNQEDKIITEIGCADYPALEHCKIGGGYLIEPLPSLILKSLVDCRLDLTLIQNKVENIDLPLSDEIWLLNVMQHVQDPDKFIEKCKASTDVIRFFEPIDWPIEIYHPHTFDFEWYQNHFPSAQRYKGNEKGFHTAHCAYGVWTKED